MLIRTLNKTLNLDTNRHSWGFSKRGREIDGELVSLWHPDLSDGLKEDLGIDPAWVTKFEVTHELQKRDGDKAATVNFKIVYEIVDDSPATEA